MKRLAAVLLVGVLLMLALPGTGLAYTGIDGTVFDDDGNPWTYGGTVYVGTWYYFHAGYSEIPVPGIKNCGNGVIDSFGNFGFDFNGNDCTEYTTQQEVPNLTLTIVFNEGPNGRPRNQDIEFHNAAYIYEHYHVGSVSANPTVVSVNALGAKSASFLPLSLPPSLVAVLAVVAILTLAWRRPIRH